MVKLVAMIMGDAGRMTCWKTSSAQYPAAHLTAIVKRPCPIIRASSRLMSISSTHREWSLKAMMLAAISTQSPALGSKIDCFFSILLTPIRLSQNACGTWPLQGNRR